MGEAVSQGLLQGLFIFGAVWGFALGFVGLLGLVMLINFVFKSVEWIVKGFLP